MRRYYATVDGATRTLDVEHLGGLRYRVRVDGGEPHEVDAQRPNSATLDVLAGTRVVDAGIEEDAGALRVLRRGESFRLELIDERERLLRSTPGHVAQAGPVTIAAPMPGKIVKVLAAEGDAVQEGQGVAVIEAMKMENELRAPRAGRVAKVLVKEGQAVEGREKILVIE